ncbi:MAG: 30S ribosomal protein S16 [Syntrophothermus sp.]
MPTKIRLQRKGKKGQPFYHIVIADGRAPREGRFIERIGTYNPLAKPAEIDIDFQKTLDWVLKGAQPTDTVKAILHYKGVMYKAHLLKGVKKGAFTEEQAEAKFQSWMNEKQEKIANKIKEQSLSQKEDNKKKLAYEKEVNEKKAAEVAKKMRVAAEAEAEARHEAEDNAPVEAPAQENTEPAAEEPQA